MRNWHRLFGVAVFAVAACSPTFDWREVRTVDGLVALFPCRPQSASRRIVVAGDRVTMDLTSCTTGGLTFAVGRIAAADPSRVAAISQALHQALRLNLSLPARSADPTQGSAASQALPQFVSVEGAGPDGEPLRVRSRFFAQGLAVYQATVMGRELKAEAVDFFFSSLESLS